MHWLEKSDADRSRNLHPLNSQAGISCKDKKGRQPAVKKNETSVRYQTRLA